MTSAELLAPISAYVVEGLIVVPTKQRSKEPCAGPGWYLWTCSANEVADKFGNCENVSLVTGLRSRNLVDIGLDCEAARYWGPRVFEATKTCGHASNPRSHYFYVATDSVPGHVVTMDVPTETERASGAQGEVKVCELGSPLVLVPPSIHPSGEPVEWTPDGAALCFLPGANISARYGELVALVLVERHAGRAAAEALAKGQDLPALPPPVLAKIRQALGLDQVQLPAPSAAPAQAKARAPTLAPKAKSWFDDVRALRVADVARAFALTEPMANTFICLACGVVERGVGDKRGPIEIRKNGFGWCCCACSANGDTVAMAALCAVGTSKPAKGSGQWGQVRAECKRRGLAS